MRHSIHLKAQRRGAVIPLFAILLIPFLGMLAFSIDLGYIVLVKTDLQAAADAAALAGAEKLQALYVQYTLPGQTAQDAIFTKATTNVAGSPMATAEAFASYNKAGNVSIKVRDQDVTFGFSGTQCSCQANYGSGSRAFPNSITVVTRRDSIQNGPVSLFFGGLFGVSAKELQATATATIYSGDVTSLRVIPGVNAHILPVALDLNIWTTFASTGLSPDGTTHLAANGAAQLQVYPSGPYQGAFGLVDVGAPANNVPAFRTWISDGETPNDISYLLNNSLLPVSPTSPKSWKDGPGLKSTLLTNFQAEMGVPNLIPLFMPYAAPSGWQAQSVGAYQPTNNSNGGGQNQTYAIVGFVGVTISEADGNGNNMNISVQPYGVVDPTAVILNPAPVGTQSSQFGCATTTFISAKLTH